MRWRCGSRHDKFSLSGTSEACKRGGGGRMFGESEDCGVAVRACVMEGSAYEVTVRLEWQ